MPRRKTNTYGQKGGTSANYGRTASTYKATAPDGTVFRKRSYQIHEPQALIGAYEHEGKWYASGVATIGTQYSRQTMLPAVKL